MRVDVSADGYDVAIDVTAYDGDEQVSHRSGPSTSRAEPGEPGSRPAVELVRQPGT